MTVTYHNFIIGDVTTLQYYYYYYYYYY